MQYICHYKNFLDNKFYDSLVLDLQAATKDTVVPIAEENAIDVKGTTFTLNAEQIFLD